MKWPANNFLLLAATASIAATTYGSLVPLNYVPLPWDETLRRAREIPWYTLGLGSRADWVANGAVYFPCSLLLTAALSLHRGPVIRGCAAISAGIFLSSWAIGVEVTQLWFPGRTVSQNDILSEIIGSCVGALTWCCFAPDVRQKLSELREVRGNSLLGSLTQLYTVAILGYGLAPFDLVLSPSEFQTKIDVGRFGWGWSDGKAMALSFFLFVPVGIGIGLKRPSFLRGLVIAAAYSTTYEILQIPVFSRTSAVSHALGACLGGIVGIALAKHVTTIIGERRMSTLVPLGYMPLVTAIYLYPFQTTRTQEWGQRFREIWRTPFSAHYFGTEFQTLNNLIARMLLFGTGGALLYLSGRLGRRVVFIGVLFCPATTELAQFLFESKFADCADATINVIAAFSGVKCARLANQRLRPC